MMLRAGGAVVNVTINAVLIFGLELGVVGAAIGTVVANVLVLAAFVTGFTVGRLPLIGEFPITIDVAWPRPTIGELRTVRYRNAARLHEHRPASGAVSDARDRRPLRTERARRLRRRSPCPGSDGHAIWGFSLASSSLVGQELGTGDERDAGTAGREVLWFGTGVYLVSGAIVLVFAEQVGRIFVADRRSCRS